MARRRVLVVDDDENIVQLVKMYLERDGYQVWTAHDGTEALLEYGRSRPDVIVLDLMLPGVSGLDVCREVRRESNVPIVMLTAKTTEVDKLTGLDLGADDYVTKPFSPRELLARIRAVLRRVPGANEGGPEEIVIGPLTLYPRRFQAEVEGKSIRLTPTEFNLVRTMAEAPGQVFSRAQLIEKAFGYDFEGFERNVDVHITSLRRKLEKGPARLIKTVYGLGYKMEADAERVGGKQ
ncbi:MAG: response regulator transcription factor [Chloroflexota bacterium]|nr:response regulator transcription factor [Chloroflexota bacterium]